MADHDRVVRPAASVTQRADAIQSALDARGLGASEAVAVRLALLL